MQLGQNQPSETCLKIYFDPVGEDVDCERMLDSELALIADGVTDVREFSCCNEKSNSCTKAVADAIRALAKKGDLVIDDYHRNFAFEFEDLQRAQQALYEGAHMHTLVGRSADRSTLFLAPLTWTMPCKRDGQAQTSCNTRFATLDEEVSWPC